MAPKSAILAACLVALLTPMPVTAAGWFVSADGGLGSANQTIEAGELSTEFERIGVLRASIGCGYKFESGISGAIEMAWSERGCGMTRTTVFRPDGDGFFEYERSYFEVSTPWSIRFRSGRSFLGAGVSPRVSFLLSEPDIFSSPTLPANSRIFGADPFAFIGYGALHLSARYVLDFGPSYEASAPTSDAKVSDSTFFIGAGVELPL